MKRRAKRRVGERESGRRKKSEKAKKRGRELAGMGKAVHTLAEAQKE
jgi:hypothetical protein